MTLWPLQGYYFAVNETSNKINVGLLQGNDGTPGPVGDPGLAGPKVKTTSVITCKQSYCY